MQDKLQSQLAGIISLSKLTTKRPFLDRNLDHVLLLGKAEREAFAKAASANREKFDLISPNLMREMENERYSPKLKISVGEIVAGSRRTSPNHPRPSITLRGRNDIVDVRCRLQIFIYNKRDTTREVYSTLRIARLHGQRQSDGKFELTTTLTEGERPFEFQMDKLKDVVQSQKVWRMAMCKAYHMRFHITFTSSVDGDRVWDALKIDSSIPSQHGLWAKCDTLPNCPKQKDYLALFASDNTTTHYALSVAMGWGTTEWIPKPNNGKRLRVETALENYLYLKRQGVGGQLPTPVSTPPSGSSITATDVTIRYHMHDCLIEEHGYRCMLCNVKAMKSLDRLEFHLVSCHFGLGFKIESDLTPGTAVDERVVDIIVSGLVEPNQRPKRFKPTVDKEDSVIDQNETVEWHAPRTPPNLQDILHNPDTRWALHKKAKDTTPGPRAPVFARVVDIRLVLPVRDKRRGPLPDHPVPTASFLSSDNKTVLKTGEIFQDEEDLLEEPHLELARQVEIQRLVPNLKEREFLTDINSYIESERMSADKFLGPCLRRWLHKRSTWLRDEAMAKMYEDFLQVAWKRGYVSEEVYKTCVDISKRIRNGQGAATSSPPVEERFTSSRRHDECFCGQKVEGLKGRLSCKNKSCKRPEHHLKCVQQSFQDRFRRDNMSTRSWYCKECLEKARTAFTQSRGDKTQILDGNDLESRTKEPELHRAHWIQVLSEHDVDPDAARLALSRLHE